VPSTKGAGAGTILRGQNMNNLIITTPSSVPEVRRALDVMEADLDCAETYEAIRKIERTAEALKILAQDVEDVRIRAEQVIVLAKHRIGTELAKLKPAQRGAGLGRGKVGIPAKPTLGATLKEQVGSKSRALRLKQLAKHPKAVIKQTVADIAATGRDINVGSVLRAISEDTARTKRAQSRAAKPLPNGMDLRISDCRKVLADIADDSAALILTDPPYQKEADPLYVWLAEFAATKLIDGGSLIFFTGHTRFARDAAICEAAGLRLWWHLVVLHDQSRRLPGVFMVCKHKPVLMFVKGTRRSRSLMPDVLRPSGRDKVEHPWAQGDGGVWPLIEQLTEPGELIVDPFAGTGTWGEIAVSMGRRWVGSDIVQGGGMLIAAE
jgi:16S rRNA G966 N2-methylase RsmD